MRLCWWMAAMPMAGAVQAAEVPPHAVMPYTAKSHPKATATWGAAALPGINRLRVAAAQKVAASKECDEVSIAELSNERSTKPAGWVVFVDCNNGKRFYLSQADVGGGEPATSVQQKAFARTPGAMAASCRAVIQGRLEFPSTYDESLLASGERRVEASGTVVTELAYTAKNRFGATLPYLGRCIFNDTGLVEVKITGR